MSFDISGFLDNWEYKPNEVLARKFIGDDGVEKIQLRVDLGILQMNVKGRPDGKRPHGRESLLEYYKSLLEKFRRENEGNDKGFRLSPEDCGRLQQEVIQYHHRYICLFQLEDFEGVILDAERNLRVFEFVEKYAASEDMAWPLQHLRPQHMMMRIRARGTLALQADLYDEVIRLVETGIEEIRQFYRQYDRQDLLETSGEIQSLEGWLEEIQKKRPMTPREKLESALNEAVRDENYEEAARVRDKLRKLN
ncbi:MAG TPA: UvrB/UvrC motif-containing protein [Verrucomicrobiae bacterium]|jgi:hypothetical protein